MPQDDSIREALGLIFSGIEMLQRVSRNSRRLTVDGRLVGDIGEIIAAREFEIELDQTQRPGHDAKTHDGRDVQIKATFGTSLTFTTEPVLYLGLKLFRDGSHELVFNGPGEIILSAYGHRKGIGKRQLSFPIANLKSLSAKVPICDRVPVRASPGWPSFAGHDTGI
jgi:hypothetical protein